MAGWTIESGHGMPLEGHRLPQISSAEQDGSCAEVLRLNAGGIDLRSQNHQLVVAGAHVSTPIYHISTFLVADLEKDGVKEVLVTSHHHYRYPNQFVLLDTSGVVLGEYWHSGHLPLLSTADWNGDGIEEIFLAGVNNGYKAAALAILDARRLNGASPQPEADPFRLQGFPDATEEAYVLLPRTCINKLMDEYNVISGLWVENNALRLGVTERMGQPERFVVYTLDSKLNVINLEYADLLKSLHRELGGCLRFS